MKIVLAMSLSLALVATGCKRQPSPTVFVDPALATLIPADTVFVAGVRVQQIHSTPIYQQYVLQRKIAFVERFRQETGIDITKDIWEVVVPFDGKSSVVMLRGKFAEMGREPRLERDGVRRFGYKKYTLIGDENSAAAFLNPTTCVAGPTPAVKRVLDNRDQTNGMPKWLLAEIQQVPSTNQAWFAGKVPLAGLNQDREGRDAPAPGSAMGNFAGAVLRLAGSIESMRGGADFRTGFESKVLVKAHKREEAKQLHDAMRGVLGFARLNTSEDRRQLLTLYDGIQVRHEESRVEVDVTVRQELLDELIRMIPDRGSVARLGSRASGF